MPEKITDLSRARRRTRNIKIQVLTSQTMRPMGYPTIQHDDIYSGSVRSRIEVSKRILGDIGEQLRENTVFQEKFTLLKQYAADVNSHMERMNLGSLCTRCSTLPSGGCCSLYMSAETDAIQLSLNALAGVDVRFMRQDGEGCVFLGETGCIFIFKPMFCLNYTCDHIKETGSHSHLQTLEHLSGRLLGKQYQVEQSILTVIKKAGTPPVIC